MTKVKDLTKILISEKGLPLVKQFSALAEHLSHSGSVEAWTSLHRDSHLIVLEG